MGWNPPPHPFEIVPSVQPNATDSDVMTFPWDPWSGSLDSAQGNFQINAVLCLFDFVHEDELLAWAAQDQATIFQLGQAGRKLRQFDPRALAHFYLHPEAYKTANWSSGAVDARWNALQAALEIVVPRRIALGPLPENTYGDPIVVYFYDTGVLKRQTYPYASLAQATAISNARWWASSGAGIEDYDPASQTWNAEGFNSSKDFGTDVATQLVQAVLAAISIVLTLTGVGAPAAAMVQIVGQAILATIQTVAAQTSGGDPTGAVLQIGISMIGSAATAAGLSPKMTKTVMSASGTGLQMLAAHFDPISNPAAADLQAAFDSLQARAASIPTLDEGATLEFVEKILTATGGSSGLAFETFFDGYWYAQFASSAELAGVTPIMGQIATGATLALWKMGSQVGALVRAQKIARPSPMAQAPAPTFAPIATIGAPIDRLMTYVVTVLKPRYHL